MSAGAYPLVYAPGVLIDDYNLPKIAFLLIVVGLLFVMAAWRWRTGEPIDVPPVALLAVAGMTLPLAFSWVLDDQRVWSLFGLHTRYGGLLPYLAAAALGMFLVDCARRRRRALAWSIVAGGMGVAGIALIQMLFLGSWVGIASDTEYVTSTLGHSNFAGGYMAVCLPIALALWLEDTRRSMLAAGSFALIAAGLLFTVSQGAWAAAFAGCAVVAGISVGHRRPLRRIYLTLGVVAAVAGVLLVSASLLVPHAYARFPGPFKTTVTRGYLWQAAVDVALDSRGIGAGPNGYAIEGPLHRPPEDSLVINFVKGDDPHSVPLAMLANGGLLGLAGFILILALGFRNARTATLKGPVLGLAGGLLAYAVQAATSVDEPSLRVAMWITAAGPLSLAPGWKARTARAPRSVGLVALILASITFVALITTAVVLLVADASAARGLKAFDRRQTSQAFSEFETALALRPFPEYRRMLAARSAQLAMVMGRPEGDVLINRMRDAFSYLEHFPDGQALSLKGELLHLWTAFDPSVAKEARATLREAQRLDRFNPLLAVLIAESHLFEGRPEAALEALRPFEQLLTEDYPEFRDRYQDVFAGLALAHHALGNLDAARGYAGGLDPDRGCRATLADIVVAGDRDDLGRLFICPRMIRRIGENLTARPS